MFFLRLISGKAEPAILRLKDDEIVIGRSSECAIRIPGANVSRKHCRMTREAEGWQIADLGSSNGTHVNGSRVEKRSLRAGDQLAVGEAVFVLDADPTSDRPTAAAESPAAPLHSMPVDFGLLIQSLLELAAEHLGVEKILLACFDSNDKTRTVWMRGFEADPLQDSSSAVSQIVRSVRARESRGGGSSGDICVPLTLPGRDNLGALFVGKPGKHAAEAVEFVRTIARRLADPLATAVEYRDLRARLAESEMEVTFKGLPAASAGPRRLGELIGRSAGMETVFATIRRVAPTDSTVLIEGETGTGKELVARSIHDFSARRTGPYVAENCAAISPTLAESALFGHVKGAFTGAERDHPGLFAQADGGTLFLDEIADMSQDIQRSLLRAIQERQIRPVGARDPIPVDVRLLAASNRPLQELVRNGSFREDLYYRINVIRIALPPLRERPDDIPLLAEQFLREYTGGSGKQFRPEALTVLLRHPWPGNIRELKNVIEGLVALSEGEAITEAEVKQALKTPDPSASSTLDFKRAKDRVIGRFEREALIRALVKHRGNLSEIAREMGLERKHLYRLIEKYGFKPEDYR